MLNSIISPSKVSKLGVNIAKYGKFQERFFTYRDFHEKYKTNK